MNARTARRLVISPCPPALLPAATGRELVPEIEQLRARLLKAVRWLRELDQPILVLTAGPGGTIANGTTLSAAAFGLSYRGSVGPSAESSPLVTPREPGALVAAYLLQEHPADIVQVSDTCAAWQQIQDRDPAAILVCGGGSARRRDGAPGYIDPRAVPYDDALAELIASGDCAVLRDADMHLADELLCDVARPLAVAARLSARWPGRLCSTVDAYDAPYGVANILARWWSK